MLLYLEIAMGFILGTLILWLGLQKLYHQLLRELQTHQQQQQQLSLAGLQEQMQTIRQELQTSLTQHANTLNQPLQQLTQQVNKQLDSLTGIVEKRLDRGFKSTTDLFTQVMSRLATIDKAQERMSELTHHVVDLQSLLNDKRSRGALGEMQLYTLIRNVLPEKAYQTQFTLSNGKRVDCVLRLPKPIGLLSIDSKFPLDAYQGLLAANGELEKKQAEKRFKTMIQTHIQDIANKYIIPQETAEGALMFIPAEAIFSEIHAHFPSLVSYAQQRNVWLVSPTTMMAVLTTAQSVLRDVETREQITIIQQHLRKLSQDFTRFHDRMSQLAKHIGQAHADVGKIQISSDKIIGHFQSIERVELQSPAPELTDINA